MNHTLHDADRHSRASETVSGNRRASRRMHGSTITHTMDFRSYCTIAISSVHHRSLIQMVETWQEMYLVKSNRDIISLMYFNSETLVRRKKFGTLDEL